MERATAAKSKTGKTGLTANAGTFPMGGPLPAHRGAWPIFRKNFRAHWQLYVLAAIPLIWLLIFQYGPMYGLTIAFKQFDAMKGIWASEWVGLKYFKTFFSSPSSVKYIYNTLALSLYQMVAGFLPPIILAICLNEVRGRFFKKTVQMVTYAPYFISMVVMVGMMIQFMDIRTGIINQILGLFGVSPVNFMGTPGYFRNIYVISGLWQNSGYNCIIYLAALSSVSPELQEACVIDGGTRIQRIWYVDLPGISTTIITLLILGMGFTMSLGFEKVYLMQNPMNIGVSEIISTFTYKVGLQQMNFSMSTAVGLFNSVINLVLLLSANFVSRKLTDTGLW